MVVYCRMLFSRAVISWIDLNTSLWKAFYKMIVGYTPCPVHLHIIILYCTFCMCQWHIKENGWGKVFSRFHGKGIFHLCTMMFKIQWLVNCSYLGKYFRFGTSTFIIHMLYQLFVEARDPLGLVGLAFLKFFDNAFYSLPYNGTNEMLCIRVMFANCLMAF